MDEVLAHWSGLGYYARGRNLHRAAKIIVEKYHGEFPREYGQIIGLPGIGRSTAAAICALAYHENRAILDGNVKRVLARYCGIEGWSGERKTEELLWRQAEVLLPKKDIAVYIQAQMDMGATLCTRSKPKCTVCPVQCECVAYNTDRVGQLPTPRKRKAVPEKRVTFLLLLHGNDILLEKRVSSGIWGGLWCPPQLEDGQGVADDYVKKNNVRINERIDLAEFTHVFTHFKLHITPVLLRMEQKPLRVQESASAWMDLGAALQAAIPAPLRVLLEQIR
jgi:A/G-specific adenine glycosylase